MIDARPGEHYTVDGCVNTTATYGDKFRPLTRFRCAAWHPRWIAAFYVTA